MAQLVPPPAAYSQNIGLWSAPSQPSFAAGELGFWVLSAVEYQGSGHTVVVSASVVSPAAQQRGVLYGDQSVQLPDGSQAQAGTGVNGGDMNQVVFDRDGYTITVAADLPVDQIVALTSNVMIDVPPVPSPTP